MSLMKRAPFQPFCDHAFPIGHRNPICENCGISAQVLSVRLAEKGYEGKPFSKVPAQVICSIVGWRKL